MQNFIDNIFFEIVIFHKGFIHHVRYFAVIVQCGFEASGGVFSSHIAITAVLSNLRVLFTYIISANISISHEENAEGQLLMSSSQFLGSLRR